VQDQIGRRGARGFLAGFFLQQLQPLRQVVQQTEQVGDFGLEQTGARGEFFGRHGRRHRVAPQLLQGGAG